MIHVKCMVNFINKKIS